VEGNKEEGELQGLNRIFGGRDLQDSARAIDAKQQHLGALAQEPLKRLTTATPAFAFCNPPILIPP
jgi:hypothetical protein